MHPESTTKKDEKLREIIREIAAQYIQRESNQSSMITVTNVVISNKGKRAVILFTVLPEEKQAVVLDFLKRHREDFQEYARSQSRIGRIPFFDFEIDLGEKNR